MAELGWYREDQPKQFEDFVSSSPAGFKTEQKLFLPMVRKLEPYLREN